MSALSNPRHEAFAQALAKGQSACDAYVTAGYKESRSAASRLSTNVNIQRRVAALVEAGAYRAEIDIARTLKEMVRLGTSDVRRLFDDNGNLLPIIDLDDDTAASVASVEVVTRSLGRGEDGEPPEVEYIHKLRLWDKNSALDKIAKHLGMFIDRHEHSGPDGKPMQVEDVSAREIVARRVAGIAARAGTAEDTGRAD